MNPHAFPMDVKRLSRFIKYCMVGVLNTLLTLGVIYICKDFLGLNLYVSNALGYVCGVTNSFLCNKTWVFRSGGSYRREAVRFIAGFAVCYLLQLGVVWMLTESPLGQFDFMFAGIVISGYGIATIIGNVFYTIANYIYNQIITFR